MPEIFLTKEGHAKLQDELKQLIDIERPLIARRLRDAIQMGDLSENADYHKAKEDQGFLEGRIQELQYLVKNATVIDTSEVSSEVVQVGSRVTVQEGDYEPELFFMVGAKEADPRGGKISNESPIGQALMGSRVGDVVTAVTPGGSVTMTILKIE
ncbi:MAG: transcription elongation factor GreA [Anaerolineales bacterium]|jgi:transcription elongation factor GreA|nr:transcription elongation factor GreA [Anaerolineales bacterium]